MASTVGSRPPIEAVLAATAPNTRGFALYLDTKAYIVAWAAIFALHTVCGTYNIAAGKFFSAAQGTTLVFRLDGYGVILNPKYFPIFAAGHYVVGGIHCYFLLSPLVCWTVHTLRRCKLAPNTRATQGTRFSTSNFLAARFASGGAYIARFASVLPQTLERRIPPTLQTPARLVYARIFGRFGIFGIESRHFDLVFFVREVFETGFQTFQAHQMCRFLTRHSLNRMFVGMLVLNCWITPILHHTKASKPLRRALDRIFDIILDLMASAGVSVALVWTYFAEFDRTEGDFPIDRWIDFIWSTTAISEVPLVFFRSWMDVLGRLTISLGLLLSLDDVKLLLRRKTTRAVRPDGQQAKIIVNAKPKSTPILKLGHRAMFLYGATVLVVHLPSELRPRMPSCLMELRPWATRETYCTVLEFSCFRNREFTGKAKEFDSVFGNLDASALKSVSFRHCFSIEVQVSLQNFPNITYLSFYNSTIVRWDANAALTQACTPKLASMTFVRTNFTGGLLPLGMRSTESSLRLTSIEFSVTNLRALPDNLGECWPAAPSLVIEFSELTEFPPVITSMALQGARLAANNIESMPSEAFEIPGLYFMSLSGNPIKFLPSNVNVNASNLYTIQLDSTSLSAVPTWLSTLATLEFRTVSLGRTPYCRQQMLSTNLSTEEVVSSIDCTDLGPVRPWFEKDLEPRLDEVW